MRNNEVHVHASGAHGEDATAPQSRHHAHGIACRGIRKRNILLIAAAALAGVLIFLIPLPFVVESPGPTFDVAGQYRGTPFITVSGTDPMTGREVKVDALHEDAGQLRMVTVSESGGPGNRLNVAALIGAYFDSASQILPYSQVYPASATREAVDAAQSSLMRSSQKSAEAAALTQLGWTVPASVRIRGTLDGSDAVGKVEDGDVLEAVIDPSGIEYEITTASAIFDLVKNTAAGTELELVLERHGSRVTRKVHTMEAGKGEKGSKLGVYLEIDVDLPLDVSFNLSEVGGPSAGMMFALGIIDRLTEGDLAGGVRIAGTGTMSYSGEVGPIGGIAQKMVGARRDGATFFLAPTSNCQEVIGHIPDGLTVVAVSNLDEALNAVHAIADGATNSLARCEATEAG